MLVGDAAGLVNPLNGEGIQYALLSGRWASEVAISCLIANDLSKEALEVYRDNVERELGYRNAPCVFNRSVNSKSKLQPNLAALDGTHGCTFQG